MKIPSSPLVKTFPSRQGIEVSGKVVKHGQVVTCDLINLILTVRQVMGVTYASEFLSLPMFVAQPVMWLTPFYFYFYKFLS